MKTPNVPPLRITRVFDAPRPEVFEWWAVAEKLSQWSGCKQCISSEVRMDFQEGGGFRQTMKISVNGHLCDFVLKGTYQEIIAPERIRYILDTGQQMISVCVEFFEEGEATKVILTQEGFETPESCGRIAQGTNDSLAELQTLVMRPGTYHFSPGEARA